MADREFIEFTEFVRNNLGPLYQEWIVGTPQNALGRLEQIIENPGISDPIREHLRNLREDWVAQLNGEWTPPAFGSDAEYYPLLARALRSAARQEHAAAADGAVEYLRYVSPGGLPFKNGLIVAIDAIAHTGDLEFAVRLARVFLSQRELTTALAAASLGPVRDVGDADRWIDHFTGIFSLGVPMRAALKGIQEAPNLCWAQIIELGLASPRPVSPLPVPPHDALYRAQGLAALVRYYEAEANTDKVRTLRELYGN